MTDDRRAIAEKLFKEGKFREAGTIYHHLSDETNNAWYTSRYLLCLRKAGYPTGAVTVGRQKLQLHPQDVWIRRELVWALYYARIKTHADSEDLLRLVQAAEEVLAFDPEPLPLKLTVNAVIRLAKLRKKWDLVSKWCDFLNPDSLEDQPREIAGRLGKSERESWHFAKVKALLEMQRWEDALVSASQAAAIYPREINFRRWAALALAGKGDIAEAIHLLQNIILKDRSEWFLLQDLCQLHLENKDLDAALRNGCRAALDCHDDTVKVSLYGLLATTSFRLSQDEFAFRHAVLAKTIREREGWSIPADLRTLEGVIRSRFNDQKIALPIIPESVREQVLACAKLWREAAYTGLPRQSGVLDFSPGDRAFDWIQGEDGQRIFVLRNDLPPAARTNGVFVNFAMEPSFDRKRQHATVRAVNVICARQNV